MHTAENYEEIVVSSNKAAIQLLKNQEYLLAKPYLDTSYSILKTKRVKNSRKLLPITLNNYGCYYKKLGKIQESLDYFHSALEVSKGKGSNVTETYLNISNALLQNGKNSEALRAASKALESLNPSRKYTKTAVLVYQALGNLYKTLGLQQESQQMYLKALITSQKVLGNAHMLTKDLESSYDSQRISRTPENFVKINSQKFRSYNLTPDLHPNTQSIQDFIPNRLSSNLSFRISEKTLKNYKMKARLLAPDDATFKGLPEIKTGSLNKLKKCNTKRFKLRKNKELTPRTPKRPNFIF